MGLLEEISKETKFRRKKYPKKYLGYKRYEFFEIRPLFDMKDNLIYQHASVLFEDDACLVMAKKSGGYIFKYTIINDLAKYKSLKLTDEMLVSYNLGKKFEYGFVIEELGSIETVDVIIMSQMEEASIRYAIMNTDCKDKLYKMGLVFDKDWNILVQFIMNKESGALSKQFKNAIYKDLGAKDVEDV